MDLRVKGSWAAWTPTEASRWNICLRHLLGFWVQGLVTHDAFAVDPKYPLSGTRYPYVEGTRRVQETSWPETLHQELLAQGMEPAATYAHTVMPSV